VDLANAIVDLLNKFDLLLQIGLAGFDAWIDLDFERCS
jgi:hypothetical protein